MQLKDYPTATKHRCDFGGKCIQFFYTIEGKSGLYVRLDYEDEDLYVLHDGNIVPVGRIEHVEETIKKLYKILN